MSQAKNCIAVHGAGLTNIIYMEQNSFVISLIHEAHPDPAFYSLANAFDHDFVLLQCAANNTDMRGYAFDGFTVDISQLKFYIEKYLKN